MQCIPFRAKRTHGIPYWEQNEWFRRHGYEYPFDTFMLLQWLIVVVCDVCFFAFLWHFVNAPEMKTMDDDITLGSAADATSMTFVSLPGAGWSWHIMAVFSVAIKILSVITSCISTEDPVVTLQRPHVPRSHTYIRKYGIPVIDGYTGVCGICQIKVARTTRHCKLCNKCVAGMDHHCRWLNCCIGESNYKLFIILISVTLSALIWYTSVVLYVVWSSVRQKNDFILQAMQAFHMEPSPSFPGAVEDDPQLHRVYYTAVTIAGILALLSVTATAAMARLLIFHIQLMYLNMTTVEYINHTSRQRAYDDNDDEDDEGFEDYYDYDDSDQEGHNVSYQSNPRRSLEWSSRVTRIWRTWMRRYLPSLYRYHRLNYHKRRRSNSGRAETRPRRRRHGMLSAQSNLKPTSDDLHLEDMFGVRTIRPAVSLLDEGPDYNDDMGLDLWALDECSSATSTNKPTRSKAARILDISDEEARLYQQSHQEQRQRT